VTLFVCDSKNNKRATDRRTGLLNVVIILIIIRMVYRLNTLLDKWNIELAYYILPILGTLYCSPNYMKVSSSVFYPSLIHASLFLVLRWCQTAVILILVLYQNAFSFFLRTFCWLFMTFRILKSSDFWATYILQIRANNFVSCTPGIIVKRHAWSSSLASGSWCGLPGKWNSFIAAQFI
jgi:hypothetical protein